jgi:hypothetical protein
MRTEGRHLEFEADQPGARPVRPPPFRRHETWIRGAGTGRPCPARPSSSTTCWRDGPGRTGSATDRPAPAASSTRARTAGPPGTAGAGPAIRHPNRSQRPGSGPGQAAQRPRRARPEPVRGSGTRARRARS